MGWSMEGESGGMGAPPSGVGAPGGAYPRGRILTVSESMKLLAFQSQSPSWS